METLRDIFSVFKSREKVYRMIICALIFIGMAIPFKVMVLIPGLTEVRPVNAVPVVAGLLLGPAGAWGCAIGNLTADLFGTFTIASGFGFLANFIAAYLPYKLWHMNSKGEAPNVKSYKNLGRYVIISSIASLCIAVILSSALDLLNITWGKSLFTIIFWNDFGFPLFLGLPIFIVLTSDQIKFNAVMPEIVVPGNKTSVYKWVLISLVAASGILFAFEVLSGMRLLQSPVMLTACLVFGTSLTAFLIKA